MKSVLFAVFAIVLGSEAGVAADMQNKAASASPTTYDWTGLYLGGDAGGSWSSFGFDDPSTAQIFNNGVGVNSFVSGPGTLYASRTSFLGGVEAGWNYQVARLVVGGEIDYSWTSIKPKVSGSFPTTTFLPLPTSGGETIGSSLTGLGTLTTRVGVARDNWILYAKVGGAWTEINYALSAKDNVGATVSNIGGISHDTRFGWILGTGVEWAFASNWTAKLEYDYIDFGSWTDTFGASGVSNFAAPTLFVANSSVNVHAALSEVKFGINYKLSPGFAFW